MYQSQTSFKTSRILTIFGWFLKKYKASSTVISNTSAIFLPLN
jgi:hypothetical protein